MTDFCLDNELKKWFYKWSRKPVTGRCLIELKNMDREFIRKLKEELYKDPEPCCHGIRERDAFKIIDGLATGELV